MSRGAPVARGTGVGRQRSYPLKRSGSSRKKRSLRGKSIWSRPPAQACMSLPWPAAVPPASRPTREPGWLSAAPLAPVPAWHQSFSAALGLAPETSVGLWCPPSQVPVMPGARPAASHGLTSGQFCFCTLSLFHRLWGPGEVSASSPVPFLPPGLPRGPRWHPLDASDLSPATRRTLEPGGASWSDGSCGPPPGHTRCPATRSQAPSLLAPSATSLRVPRRWGAQNHAACDRSEQMYRHEYIFQDENNRF